MVEFLTHLNLVLSKQNDLKFSEKLCGMYVHLIRQNQVKDYLWSSMQKEPVEFLNSQDEVGQQPPHDLTSVFHFDNKKKASQHYKDCL